MSDCEGMEELLSAFADGETGEGERRRVEAHLAFCAACRLRLRWINGAKAALAGLPSPALPAELKARLLEQIPPPVAVGGPLDEARDFGWTGWAGALARRPWGYGLAAGLALAALVVAVRLPERGEAIPLEAMVAAHHQYAASLPSSAAAGEAVEEALHE